MKALSDQDAFVALARLDFKTFLALAFKVLHPNTPFLDNWSIDAIVHQLEQSYTGVCRRSILNLPPRHLKSIIVSVAWPAFLWGREPSYKFMCVSYSDDLTRDIARMFRTVVESPMYRKVFPHVKVIKATENEVRTDAGGIRYATSVGGTITGKGADLLIIDDPIKPTDAQSDKSRNAVNEWLRSTLLSRLNDQEYGGLFLVMQRLHVNDPTGFLEAGGGFKKLSLPAIATKKEIIELGDGRQHVRQMGEPLHAEHQSLTILHALRDSLGQFTFQSQYQQSPAIPDGAMFLNRWFKRTPKVSPPLARAKYFLSIDAATSQAETADYTAISVVRIQPGQCLVLKAERGRWTYEQLKPKVQSYINAMGSVHQPLNVVIEAASAGMSLISYFRPLSRDDRRFNVLHYHPREGKQTRAAYAVPYFDTGKVVILDMAPGNDWVEGYINEFVTFPHGRFDDQVDSLTQLLVSPHVRPLIDEGLSLASAW